MAHDTSVLPREPMTTRLREAFQEFVGANFPVGLSAIPMLDDADGSKVQAPPPYFILYPLWETSLEGTWNEPDADVEWTYQWSCFAERGDQLELMRDKVRTFMLSRRGGVFVHPLVVEGMHVIDVYLKEDAGGDPDVKSGILPSDMRFGIRVTPDYDTT